MNNDGRGVGNGMGVVDSDAVGSFLELVKTQGMTSDEAVAQLSLEVRSKNWSAATFMACQRAIRGGR